MAFHSDDKTNTETSGVLDIYLEREGNRNVREDMLQHANCDQINAASEFVLNLLKNRVPLSPPTAARLKHHKQVLRGLAKRRNSLERRKQGASFRRGLNKYGNRLKMQERYIQ